MSSSNESHDFHEICDAVRRGVDRIAITAAVASLAAPCFAGTAKHSATRNYVSAVRGKTLLRLLHLQLPGRTIPSVAAQLSELDLTVSAVLVLGSITPEDTTTLRCDVATRNGPALLFELDLVTATLAASAISRLRADGVPPRSGGIVIAGADRAPLLTATLQRARCATVEHWGTRDRSIDSLRNMMRTNDVLIALDDRVPPDVAPARTVRPAIDPTENCSLVLPGLLSAVSGFGATSVTPDLLAASALALALLTERNQLLPEPDEPLLVAAVARYVTRALRDKRTAW